MKKYLIAIDQGTTSTRAILYDRGCNVVSAVSKAHKQIYPRPGWSSHDANEIYLNAEECVDGAIKKANANAEEISAIGITNQRETVVAWNKKTGEPICDAIVWQCRRTADICERAAKDIPDLIRKKTGLVADPYFSASKIMWILQNIPGARALADMDKLAAGTIDSFLIWKMTGGEKFATDFSNSSRTMLFDIEKLNWDAELLKYFTIPENILPETVPTSGFIGAHKKTGIPIAAAAGDQQAALFGQLCLNAGDIKNTYGTGCFILMNTGRNLVIPSSRLLATIAWNINGETVYALEGSVFNAGSAIDWLVSKAGLAKDIDEINKICNETNGSGVFFVPAFSGLGAPHWDMRARGLICGMSLDTGKNEIVRACVESIAYQSKDVIECMKNETNAGVNILRADGGACRSDFLMRFQADILKISVARPDNIETTALGAAFLAGLAVNFWDEAKIKSFEKKAEVFYPAMTDAELCERYGEWQRAVLRAK